jgi:predicted small secreted protein
VKTNRLLLIAALCLSLLLTGCGGDSGDGTIIGTGGGGDTPSGDPADATVGSVTLTFQGGGRDNYVGRQWYFFRGGQGFSC